MAFFDMPLEQLQDYAPEVQRPADFSEFWDRTLKNARGYPINAQFERVDYGLPLVEIYDATFNGYGGQPVKGWFVLPAARSEPLPCVVEYIGYGGGRGFGFEHLLWSNAGYAYFLMDTRGQGSAWRQGDTPDLLEGANPFFPGFMTQGILNPETYYYRRVMTDAVRAIEAARAHPAVDPRRIAVTGASQGGGLSIAAAALMPDVEVVMPDVPFLCHFYRATTITNAAPYSEITRYLSIHRDKEEAVYHTLSYFDGVNFAPLTQARALYSVALMDEICPPSTVFAAYNRVASEKHINVYTFNGHEGGVAYHTLEKLRYLKALWG
ncbi:MAG: acetylxylan esterase [Anaerolineae bacterium]